jgi:hypothetical protein
MFGSVLLGDSACSSGFGSSPSGEQLQITIEPGTNLGTTSRLPLSFTQSDTYTVNVSAIKDGKVDTGFNGYVRLSSQPGTVETVTGPNTNGRNVQLVHGVASGVQVQILAAYGDTRIWVEDLGYVPADPQGLHPPECSNGIDDNRNDLIDYPADPGCYLANDDTENGGTYAAGSSEAIHYYVPRVADVNGANTGGTSGTPFASQALSIDSGYRGGTNFAFNVIVTYVAPGGFYVTDINEDAPGGGGYGSVYAYNFDAPPNMRQCDRLMAFGGTASNYYGLTELNYPTWELDEWNPATRGCGIPNPHTLAEDCTGHFDPVTGLIDDCYVIGQGVGTLESIESALVRLETVPAAMVTDPKTGLQTLRSGSQIHIGAHMGPGHPVGPGYVPTADATNCDLNGDGKVNHTTGTAENTCSLACTADLECSEYSNYLSENQFNFVVEGLGLPDASGNPKPLGQFDIQGDGASDGAFNPVLLKGTALRAFTGVLTYFSGGSQFTIDARCADDIITDLNASPIPSDTACVHARTILDDSETN